MTVTRDEGIDVPGELTYVTTSKPTQPERLTGEWAADEFGNTNIGERAPVIRLQVGVRVLDPLVAVC